MSFDIGLGGAFIAGLVSFLTPCILPIVPFYLCYMAGVSLEEASGDAAAQGSSRRKLLLSSVLFSAGVVTVFVLLGASASIFGQQFRAHFDVLKFIAAAILAVLGLHFLGIFKIQMLYRQARFEPSAPTGYLGAYLIGLAFAFGWTPCVGPVLAAILFTASAQDTAGQGSMLLASYGIGMTLPFVLAGFFLGTFMRWMKSFRRYLGVMERGIGVVLIVFAALIATDSVNLIAQWMLETFPAFGALG